MNAVAGLEKNMYRMTHKGKFIADKPLDAGSWEKHGEAGTFVWCSLQQCIDKQGNDNLTEGKRTWLGMQNINIIFM
jgi:hypothetical protein